MQTTFVARLALGLLMLVLGGLPSAAWALSPGCAAANGQSGTILPDETLTLVDGQQFYRGETIRLNLDTAPQGTNVLMLLPDGGFVKLFRITTNAHTLRSNAQGSVIVSNYDEGTFNYTLSCIAPTIDLSPDALAEARVGTAYSQTLSATGGTGTYTYAVLSGTVPGWLNMISGVISGTPTAAGTFNFTIVAIDGNGYRGEQAYTLTVAPPPLSAAITSQTNVSCPGFEHWEGDGSLSVTASGGVPPYFYSWGPSGGSSSHASGLSAGTYTVTVQDMTGATTTASATITAPDPFVWSSLASGAVGSAYAGTISTTGGTGARTYTIASGALPPGLTLAADGAVTGTPDAAGSYDVQVSVTDGNACTAPHAYTLVIGKATQAIAGFATTPAAPTLVEGGTFTVSATPGASSSPVVFASTSASVCTVSGNTVTMLAAGTCSLTADQAGDGNYSAAPQVTLEVAIGAAAQAITHFAANPAAPAFTPNGTFLISATGGASSSPLVFASTSASVCTVSGNTVTMLAAGMCSLTADQAGDANYSAAPQVVLDVAIGRATPDLDWIGDLRKSFGESAFELPDPASDSDGAFSFASSNATVATINGRTVTLAGAGSTILTATQAATANYAAASVSFTLAVDDRPDPTRDPTVSGGLQAQVDASVRFAAAQQASIGDRLRQVRSSGANPSHNGVALNVAGGPALMLSGGQVAGDKPERVHGWGVWSAGSITTGERDARSPGDGFEFSSDGVTVGADRLFGNALFGVAAGLGWNDTDLDPAGSQLDASQRSLAAYGLWRAGEHWYVDGLIGFGRLQFDIGRWSAVAGALASAQRDGDQWFGSLSAGYQHQAESMMLTGYGRLDASRTTLDAYRESGLGLYDLAYREQRIDGSSVALGVEGSYRIRSGSRNWRPFWLAEYRNALEDSTTAGINYVVQPRDTDYVLGLRSLDRNVWAFGGGVDLDFDSGWALSLVFRRERSDHIDSNSIGFRVSYGAPPTSASPELLGGAREPAATAP